MEGNRRIILCEPGAILEGSKPGEVTRRPPIRRVVYAVRKDKPSAGEGLIGSHMVGGQWFREYTIRAESVSANPTEDWWILDEDGRRLKIDGIAEKTSGPWARYFVLTCVRTDTGEGVC